MLEVMPAGNFGDWLLWIWERFVFNSNSQFFPHLIGVLPRSQQVDHLLDRGDIAQDGLKIGTDLPRNRVKIC